MRSIAFLPLAASLTLVALDARAEPPLPPPTPLPAPTTPMLLHVAPPPLGAVDALEPPPPAPPGALVIELPADETKDKGKSEAKWISPEPETVPNRSRRRMLIAGGVLTGIGGFGLSLGTILILIGGRDGTAGAFGVGMNILFGSLLLPGIPLLAVGSKMPRNVPAKTSLSLIPGPGCAMLQGSF